MIRIIFGNGEIMTCENVEKIYIEEETFNAVEFHVVGSIKEKKDVRNSDSRITESNKNIRSETPIS